MSGFDVLGNAATKPAQAPPAAEMAGFLANLLRAKHRLMTAVDLNHWTKQFEGLLAKHEEDQVRLILGWYALNLERPGVPRIHSAAGFRSKFQALMAAREDAVLGIDPAVVAVAERLAEQESWPNGMDADLQRLLQVTMQNYRLWRPKLVAVGAGTGRLASFATYCEKAYFPGGPKGELEFAIEWAMRMRKGPARWWSGKTVGLAFGSGSPFLVRFGRAIAHEYCGEGILWDRLTEAMDAKR